PRASIGLAQASKAHAFIQGRAYVTPEDVKTVAMEVMRHRLILSYEAEAEEVSPEIVIQKILDSVDVP
ncbi:MAG TPA: ATPase, partial [Fibrobacter sp.]|nr:ATPase [Fibrobacter sp.]